MPNASGTKPLTSSTFYILLALADRDRHGLGIAADVEDRTGGAVHIGPGTLYNAIRKLLDDGMIEEGGQRDQVGDDPRRRYYSITPAGRSSVRAEAARLRTILRVAEEKALFDGSDA